MQTVIQCTECIFYVYPSQNMANLRDSVLSKQATYIPRGQATRKDLVTLNLYHFVQYKSLYCGIPDVVCCASCPSVFPKMLLDEMLNWNFVLAAMPSVSLYCIYPSLLSSIGPLLYSFPFCVFVYAILKVCGEPPL